MRHRVVLATDSLDPSGLGEHMLTLAGALAQDCDVTIASPTTEAAGLFLSRAATSGLAVKSIILDELDQFTLWLKRSRATLLHLHAGIGWEGLELAKAGRAAGIPVVRTEHLPFVLTDRRQIVRYRWALRYVDRVITVSEASAASYAKAGHAGSQFLTIRNGIVPRSAEASRSTVRHRLGIAPHEAMVLTVARFTAQKGHKTLVAAMPAVLRAHPLARFVLVGTGPERDAVEAMIAARDLAGAVLLLGQRHDVADLLGAADLFVLPSEFEGLPLALLEAMAAGVPVVATSIGGSQEAIGPGHPYLVPPRDPHALAGAILAVLDEPVAAASASQQARTRFENDFQASRMAEETAAVYATLLAPEPAIFDLSAPQQKEPSMDQTRIGFIGVGGIANRHLGVLEQFDDVALVAFADLDLARAEDAARRFGARAFIRFDEMLAQCELDAVYICIPPFAHGGAEQALIERGLPFFVEKPLSLDIGLAERIAAGVEAKRLVTAVGYHWRYLDTVEEARRILSDRPAQLVSGYWLDQTPPPQWWWIKDRSGGQMVEQTTHIIDLARHLVGDVEQVFGLAGHLPRERFPGLDVPTVSTASLKFRSGAVGNIASTCLLNWGHRVGLHLFGDGIAIELTDHDMMVDVGAGRPYRHAEGDPVWREDRDFIDAVRGGENRIRCPYVEALETHRVALAIARSAEAGQPILVQDAA